MNASNADGVRDKTEYRDYWTIWYNVDTPADDGGDYETVERILQVYNKICNKGFQICAAQCQVHGHENEVFDEKTYPPNNSDVLERHCTTEGIICKNGDQSSGSGLCQDYQIQFRCQYTGDSSSPTSYFNTLDIRIYVILALVPLLLIFARMLWVYVYRRRHHRGRNPASRESNGDNVNGLSKAPPSYQDLFGRDGSSIFSICRENLPVCSLCQCTPCSVALIINQTRVSENAKVKKQAGQLEPDSAAHVVAESQTVNRIVDTVNKTNTSAEPNASNLFQGQAAPPGEATTMYIDSSDITNVYVEITPNTDSPNHEVALEPAQMNGMDNININNELSEEIYPNRHAQLKSRATVSSSSCEVQPGSSHLELSLNPGSLTSSNISEPCACKCHRTIPSKQNGVSGYDHSGHISEAIDTETNRLSVYVNVHRPVLDHDGVQSETDRSPSLTQLELPTYEDALELMKLKGEMKVRQHTERAPMPN